MAHWMIEPLLYGTHREKNKINLIWMIKYTIYGTQRINPTTRTIIFRRKTHRYTTDIASLGFIQDTPIFKPSVGYYGNRAFLNFQKNYPQGSSYERYKTFGEEIRSL